MFRLEAPVSRIECVDISHTSGKETYGSTVVWERGRLIKDHYRLYAIKDQKNSDDYAAIAEVIERRFEGSASKEMPIPELLLIDGGKGQMSRVLEVARNRKIDLPAIAAISKARSAKKKGGPSVTDEIFIPGRSNPLNIRKHSGAFHLLQMIRDEAHRFALSSHRRKRGKEDLLSRLDGVAGVGPSRRKALLDRFRSVAEIKAARVDEIASLKGFNMSVAKKIKEALE